MRLRWKKHILMPVLMVLVLVVCIVYLLLNTAKGNQWLLRQVFSEETISYTDWQGDVFSGLTLNGVRYQDTGVDLSAGQLSLALEFWPLLSKTAIIETLAVQEVLIDIHDQEKVENDAETPLVINVPIDILAPSVRVQNMRLTGGSLDHQINTIELNASVENNLLRLQKLAYTDPQVTAQVDGSLDLITLNSSGVNYIADVMQDELIIHVSGQLTHLNDLLKANGSATVDMPEDRLSVESLDYAVVLEQQSELTANIDANGWIEQNDRKIHFQHASIYASSDLKNFDAEIQLPVTAETGESATVTAFWKGNVTDSEVRADIETSQAENLSLIARLNIQDNLQMAGAINSSSFDVSPWIQQTLQLSDTVVPFKIEQHSDSMEARIEGFKTGLLMTGEPLELTGDAVFKQGVLTLETVRLQSDTGSITVSGAVQDAALNLNVNSQGFNVAQVMPDVSAVLNGQVVLEGSIRQPKVNVDAVIEQIAFADVSVASAKVEGTGVFPEVEMNIDLQSPRYADHAFKSVQLNWLPDSQTTRMQLRSEDTQGRLLAFVYRGALDVTTGMRLQGEIEQFSVDLQDLGSWALAQSTALQLDTAQSNIQLAPLCLESVNTGEVCLDASGAWSAEDLSGLQARISVSQLPLDLWQRISPSSTYLEGAADGQFLLKQGQINGQLRLQNTQLVYELDETIQREKVERALIEVAGDLEDIKTTLDIDVADVGAIKGELALRSYTTDEAEIKGLLTANLDSIEALPAVAPFIAQAQGSMDWHIELSGAWPTPQMNAKGVLSDGFILLAQNGMRLEQIKLDVVQKNPDQLNFNLSAQQQQESLQVSGTVDQLWRADRIIQAQLKTSDFTYFDVPEFQLKGSSDLELVLQGEQLSLTGDIVLTDGYFTGYEYTPAITVSEDAVIHETSQPAVSSRFVTHLDIGVKIPSGLKIDALGLDAKVLGKLQLRTSEQAKQLGGYGQLELQDGSYEIYGQKLNITQGLLDFNGSLSNPGLSVTAERLIDTNLSVGVRMGGTVNKPRSDLYSNPTLPETDILSYLITGRNLNEGSGDGENQLAQAATLLGVKSVLPKLQNALGIDLIRVDQSKGTKNTALEVEKNLSEKLTIGYSYGLFNEAGFWLLKYQLSKVLRLESAYGETQAVDLIYSITRD